MICRRSDCVLTPGVTITGVEYCRLCRVCEDSRAQHDYRFTYRYPVPVVVSEVTEVSEVSLASGRLSVARCGIC